MLVSGPHVTMHLSDVDKLQFTVKTHLQLKLGMQVPPVTSVDCLNITYISSFPNYKAAALPFVYNQSQLSL